MASANTQASHQSSNLAAQEKTNMEEAIQLEIAKGITGVPWKSPWEVQETLQEHRKAVETVIKLSVPLDHPDFGMQALKILLDLDLDTMLTPGYSTRDESEQILFGARIEVLTKELDKMIDGFVEGNHGQLTGWKADIDKVIEKQFQRTGKRMTTTEVKKRFLSEQHKCITKWIDNHNEAYEKKLWVSLQVATQHSNLRIANLLTTFILQMKWVPQIIRSDTVRLYYAVEHCVRGWNPGDKIKETFPNPEERESFIWRHKDNIERY